MSLLLLHFVKPEEDQDDDDKPALPPSQIRDNLVEFFKEEYQDVESYLELKNTSQTLEFVDYIKAIRRICAEILVVKCGMTIFQFQSRDDDEVFMKIQCDDELLKQQAYRTKYSMVHKIEHNEEFREIPPSAHFNIEAEHEFSALRNVDRIRLMDGIIKEHIVINSLIKHEILIDYYPLHEESEIEAFKKELCGPLSPTICYDMDHVREYFGERMMFYFLWMKFYTDGLQIPSLFGLVLYLMSWICPGSAFYDICELLFALGLALWGAWFIIAWRRLQSYYTLRYATGDCKDTEDTRPEFSGTMRKNPITGRAELFFPPDTRRIRQVVSFVTMVVLMGGIVATVVAIFMYKAILEFTSENADEGWGPFICASLSSLQVRFFNYCYEWIAVKLTDWENYKTQPEYEDALIIKVFVYQAIDNYVPLIYIAFFQSMYEGCENNDCMGELNYQLWITLGWNMLCNVYELGQPIWEKKREFDEEEKKAVKMMNEGKTARITMSYPEVQGKFETVCFTEEYLEMVINFGYIALFCVAFPLGPFVYWISHLVEIKVDSYKFLNFTKRPFPEKAKDIGIWEGILQFLVIASIFSNTALIVFNESVFEPTWGTFIAIEHAMLIMLAFLMCYISDKDDVTRGYIKRHEFLSESHKLKTVTLKFIKGKPDHDVHVNDESE